MPDDDRYELDVLIAGVEAAAVKFAKLAALAASSHEASSTAATAGSAVGGGVGNGGVQWWGVEVQVHRGRRTATLPCLLWLPSAVVPALPAAAAAAEVALGRL